MIGFYLGQFFRRIPLLGILYHFAQAVKFIWRAFR